MKYTVVHNVEANRFEVLLDNGQTAYLEYHEITVGLNFAHTYVPKGYEGKGIAAAIVQFGLEYVRKNNLLLIPSCSYVATYIERHPEFKSLVVKF